MGFLSKLFSDGAGSLIGSVGKVVDDLVTTKEEKEQLKIKLEKELNSHMYRMAELANSQVELDYVDKQSARQMQMEALRQSDTFSKRFTYFIAAFILLSATLFGVFLAFIEIPEANKRLFEMFADIYLFGGAITVIQFFFGSSTGSKNKDIQTITTNGNIKRDSI